MTDMPPVPTDDPGARPGVHLSHRQILLVFAGLMLGMFLSALDQTIVSAALPTIAGDLGGQDEITWVVTSYLLTSTVTILLWGKLSDIYGRKTMFQVSIATFLAASAFIGLAWDMPSLILGRGLQGIGAGGIMSLAFAIIGDILSPRERGKYMGLMGTVFLVSSVVGPLLGGAIIDAGARGDGHLLGVDAWRWIFYVNLPVGIPALFLTGIVLRLPFHRQAQRIDATGAAVLVVAASALILGLVWGGGPAPWDHATTLHWFPGTGGAGGGFASDWLVPLLIAGGLLLGAAFVWLEARRPHALLPVRLFRNRAFTLSSLTSFVIGAAMFGGFVFLPTYLQISTGVSATHSGLLLLPMILGLMPLSTASGIIISRTGRYKWWPLAGLPLAAAGMGVLSQVSPETPQWQVGVGMFLLGAGIGMVMQVMVLVSQNALERRDMGIGTAANNFMRSIGAVIGVALFGAVYVSDLRGGIRQSPQAAALLQSSPGEIHNLDPAVRGPIEAAVATGVGHVFLYAIPAIALAWILVALIPEVPLRSSRNVGAAAAAQGSEKITAVAAAEETAPVAPTPPVLPAASPPRARPSLSPADLRPAPPARRPRLTEAELRELQRKVDRLPPPRRRIGF